MFSFNEKAESKKSIKKKKETTVSKIISEANSPTDETNILQKS
jgi:hypothetical protein